MIPLLSSVESPRWDAHSFAHGYRLASTPTTIAIQRQGVPHGGGIALSRCAAGLRRPYPDTTNAAPMLMPSAVSVDSTFGGATGYTFHVSRSSRSIWQDCVERSPCLTRDCWVSTVLVLRDGKEVARPQGQTPTLLGTINTSINRCDHRPLTIDHFGAE